MPYSSACICSWLSVLNKVEKYSMEELLIWVLLDEGVLFYHLFFARCLWILKQVGVSLSAHVSVVFSELYESFL